MSDAKQALQTALQSRGQFDAADPLGVAWPGRLLELSGVFDEGSNDHSTAALWGLSNRAGYLLTRSDLVTFALTDVDAVYAQQPSRFGFTVSTPGREKMTVALMVEFAVAMATQLQAMIRSASKGVPWFEPETSPATTARRTPAKRRLHDS